MAHSSIIGNRSTNLFRTIILKILLSVFLVINIGVAFLCVLSGIDELTFGHDDGRAILRFVVGIIILASSLLLVAGMFSLRLRLSKKDFPLILLGIALGQIIGSLVVFTWSGCCMIQYVIGLGFPVPFLSLEIARDLSPALPIGSLQPWPLIYGQVFAYMQQNILQHPDVINWSGWAIFLDLFFYVHASIILFFVCHGVQHLIIRSKNLK